MFWIVIAAAAMAGAAAAIAYARQDLTLSHYDARAHLVVARRVIDNLTPGWRQLGALWLPLPHVINLLPVQSDWAYRTGAIAVAISVLSLAGGLASLARYLQRHSGSTAIAVLSPLMILGNPNLLYLQSTPMTEPLLIGLSLAALDAVDRWTALGRWQDARRAGWLLAALVLVRYEGWVIAAGFVAIAAAALASHGRRRALAIVPYPLAAVLAFLCLSRAATGSWLVTSGFFVPENPSAHQPLAALREVVTATRDMAGGVLTIAGAAGGLACLLRVRASTASALPLALLLPAVLPIAAFTAGHPHRIRYMVPLVAACGVLAGMALGRLPARARALGAAALIAAALVSRPPAGANIPMVIEAQRETPSRQRREAVTRHLASRHDGSPILASMGSLGHYMQETAAIGLDLRQFLHEGNGDLWVEALRSPRSHVKWILIEELAEGGDMLALRARQDPDFLAGFVRVAEGGGVALYERKD